MPRFLGRVTGGPMRTPIFLLVLAPLMASLAGGKNSEILSPKPEDAAQLEPPQGGQGFQFQTEDITLDVGVEEQDCYFFKVSELAEKGGLDPTKPVNLHRIQVAQRAGSHHMNLF